MLTVCALGVIKVSQTNTELLLCAVHAIFYSVPLNLKSAYLDLLILFLL